MLKMRHNRLKLLLITLWCNFTVNYAYAASSTVIEDMTTKRVGHTAILLPNKHVLVTGGGYTKDDGTIQYLASTETYDPVSGEWTQVGSLSTGCSDHAVALLQNGKVLVMGGYNVNYLANSWLYNYETRQWTSNCCLSNRRQYHTATLLNTGKVLVVGGYQGFSSGNVWQVLPNELYDPVLARWTELVADNGAIAAARKQHTATLLSNGKVLVTGGHYGSNALTNSMLYDPATGQWSQTGELITGRFNHTATLLFNGKVLVAGGRQRLADAYLNSAELYDPVTGQWSQTGHLNIGRALHTATLLPNRKVLIAGGYNDAYTDSVELYNIATGLWVPTANLVTARGGHTATLLSDGRVLIAGGIGETELNSAEIYAPDLITTTATLTSSLNPSNINQSVTFTAQVASTPTTSITPIPVGTVKFKVDGTIKAVSNLNNGQVTYITNSLAAGNRIIKAEYAGNFIWSSSNTQLTQVVNPVGVDLVITNVTLNPVVPLPNQPFVARVVVKNQGTRPSASSNLSLWFNQPSEEICRATSDKKQAVGTLAAGVSKVLYFTVLTATTVGDKTLRTFVDSDCTVGEVGETNNQFTTEYTVGMPDLTITSINLIPADTSSNTAFQANVVIKNQGTIISSPTFLDLWLNQAANQSCGAAGNQWKLVESLAAGASRTIPFTGLVTTAGAKTMRAYIDSWCESTDSNRTNNQLTKAYTVTNKPDFVINSVTLIPATPTANSTFTVVTVITNQGTIVGNAGNLKLWSNQTTDQTCSAAGDKVVSVGILAANATSSFTINGLSAGAVGTKTLRAFVDGNCITTESNEPNNQYSQVYTVR